MRAAQVYESMSELQKNQGGIFYAAKSLEQAALLYKEKGAFEKVPALFKNAAQFYRENGSVDTAANCLERGAKILEVPIPSQAAELYELASDTNEVGWGFSDLAWICCLSLIQCFLRRSTRTFRT